MAARRGVNGMDLAKDDYVVSMDAVQPDFEIIAKDGKKTTQNLEELENEDIQGLSDHDHAHRRPKRVTAAHRSRRIPHHLRAGGKGVVEYEDHDRNGSVVSTLQSPKSPT